MYKIEYVPPIQLVDPSGRAMVKKIETKDGVAFEALMAEQFEFLMERTIDEPFVNGLRGMEAQEFVVEVRAALKAQREEAKERGFWLLENEPARRMKKSIVDGNYNGLAFNHVTFMRAGRDMKLLDEAA